ncbi:ABC transporter ATP-binding protein [Campylobacter pinnipediorum]|uniref:ABC transporter ATP-binding protein n=1 Tax=Campylobacter pinnipediorum TaxID=1965231 RepID=UPI00084D4FC5|nr:ABC transporter ATP-binding protein [Campylobacter pinnipediorum]AQW80434.1 ferrirhodotorulic acid ABC transporter, ATP-binding protein [Campylobacter pinnipediorum subsp. pinnipediorum]AQW82104.1 ferrirhodotorulic acid ABC transporter, ATP-binding protein [Campylobacter pinnipediorum subsp. pinnipediorum]AQW83782.1 ferrirhodotorulic acid ABC transporter, ATP-binding protein [Campylobacter pinnipediorum subsp. pinnipediorum]
MNALELKSVCKHFGDVKALDDISFDVKRGEWLSVMGPSGSGKSTLVNILSLMDTPTSGFYILGGDDASKLSPDDTLKFRREKIGLIFQQFHLIPYLNAIENVMIAQHYHSSVDKDDAIKALEMVGLGHRLDHLPSQLSGGEQQRLCIARSLINDPEILIADEPTGNLDEANERVILDLFCKLKEQGKTILLVTHNPDLGEYGDKIVYLRHGKLEKIRVIENNK